MKWILFEYIMAVEGSTFWYLYNSFFLKVHDDREEASKVYIHMKISYEIFEGVWNLA